MRTKAPVRVWALGRALAAMHGCTATILMPTDAVSAHVPPLLRGAASECAIYLPVVQVYLDRSSHVYLDLELADSLLDQVTCLR